MEEQLAQNLAERFDEFGLRFREPIDLKNVPHLDTIPVTLTHEQGHAAYRVGFADTLIASSVDWAKPHYLQNKRLLLLGPRVTERSARMFRQLGINYLDQSGNAFITFAGVHIDVRGRRAPSSHHGTGLSHLTRGGVNLFSTKRSQVIFALLSWPELLEGSVRELGAASGVSVGQVQETLELLSQYGFLNERRQLAPSRREYLIDQWAAAYQTGLGSAARSGRFSGDWQQLETGDMAVYLSGEAAVPDLLRPETVVLYTEEFPTDMIRVHRWRRNNEHPTIFFRRQFWRSQHDPTGPGVHRAPWLLIYADLLASNDSRQREAAEQLREQQR